jgi:hypothetical protein
VFVGRCGRRRKLAPGCGDMDIVVTEHGVADVREKTMDERHHGLAKRRRGPTCESSKRRHCASGVSHHTCG